MDTNDLAPVAEPTPPPERQSLRTGMGFAASSFVVHTVVQLASAVITARIYGIDVIGEFALASAPWFTLIQFSNMSEQIALVRALSILPARDRRVGQLFYPVLAFSSALTAAVAVVVLLLSTAALNGAIGQPELVGPAVVLVVAYVLLENVAWNLDSVFSGFRAARQLFLGRVTQLVSFLLLAVGLGIYRSSVWSLVLATVLSYALALVVRLVLVRAYLPRLSFRDLRTGASELPDLLRFASKLVPGSIASGLSSQAAVWILGATASVSAVGAYSRAAGVAVRINDAGHRVKEILFPSLVERHANDDAGGLERHLLLTLRFTAIALFFVVATAGGAAPGALEIFGDGFARAADAFALLLLAYTFSVLSTTQGSAILALGRPLVTTGFVIFRSVVIVGVMIPAAITWGATGAGAAFAFGFGLDLVLRMRYVSRNVLGERGFAPVRPTIVALAVATTAGFVVARVIVGLLPGVPGAAVAMPVAAVIYLVGLIALGGLSDEERGSVVASLRARISRSH